MYVGANGCGWVSMGAVGYRGTNTQQNKVSRGKMGKQGVFSGSMAGEISPTIMFFEIRRRGAQIHVNTSK